MNDPTSRAFSAKAPGFDRPIQHPRKQGMTRAIPDAAARLLTRHLRMGSFLVATMAKPATQ